MAVVYFLVLSGHSHRHTSGADLRAPVGHYRPVQRLLQGMRRRSEGFSQGHAAAARVGAKHGQGPAAVLK